MDDLSPKVTTSYNNIPRRLKTPIYVFSKPLLTATHSIIHYHSFRVGEKINSPSETDWNSIGFTIDLLYIIYIDYDFCYCFHV